MTFIDNLKSAIKKRTYDNAQILNLNYKNKKGKEINEEVILKRSNGFLGDWKKIHPIVNKDDSFNWLNFTVGGWRNAVKLSIAAILVILFLYQFGGMLKYLDGDKYVIVSHKNFETYCARGLEDPESLIEYGNFSFLEDIKIGDERKKNG